MMNDQAKALALKAEGNKAFTQGDYSRAEGLYSQGMVHDPNLLALYSNRALTRFKLEDYNGALVDCETCLNHDPSSVKAHLLKSRSLLALGTDLDAACASARAAYDSCRLSDDKSLQQSVEQLLKCRTERWKRKESSRKRATGDLERKMLELLDRETEREVSEIADEGESGDVERKIVREEGEAQKKDLMEVFERARADDEKTREVPEWLIDDISFNVMTDPVTTHNGRSYDRASIQAAINNNAIDPVTREPLAKGELIPNIVLKQACEWYLEKNEWAYDW